MGEGEGMRPDELGEKWEGMGVVFISEERRRTVFCVTGCRGVATPTQAMAKRAGDGVWNSEGGGLTRVACQDKT